MQATRSNFQAQLQRIQAELEPLERGQCVKIRVEHYDECLGWYTSSSLSLPLRQLPLLQQALARLNAQAPAEKPAPPNVIPFPGPARGGST